MKKVGFVWFFLLFFFCFSLVLAKPWKGVIPGVTTKRQVLDKFGKPTRTFSKKGKLSDGINYQGDQAIEGALEANFYFNTHGILFRIDVFPSRKIAKEDIVRIFGKGYVERTARSGHTVFKYRSDGMMVVFDKDQDLVASFMFTQPKQDRMP